MDRKVVVEKLQYGSQHYFRLGYDQFNSLPSDIPDTHESPNSQLLSTKQTERKKSYSKKGQTTAPKGRPRKNKKNDFDNVKRTSLSSDCVQNFMQQDIIEKELEILHNLTDVNYAACEARVLEILNSRYGDKLQKNLEKLLMKNNYRDIAQGRKSIQGIPGYDFMFGDDLRMEDIQPSYVAMETFQNVMVENAEPRVFATITASGQIIWNIDYTQPEEKITPKKRKKRSPISRKTTLKDKEMLKPRKEAKGSNTTLYNDDDGKEVPKNQITVGISKDNPLKNQKKALTIKKTTEQRKASKTAYQTITINNNEIFESQKTGSEKNEQLVSVLNNNSNEDSNNYKKINVLQNVVLKPRLKTHLKSNILLQNQNEVYKKETNPLFSNNVTNKNLKYNNNYDLGEFFNDKDYSQTFGNTINIGPETSLKTIKKRVEADWSEVDFIASIDWNEIDFLTTGKEKFDKNNATKAFNETNKFNCENNLTELGIEMKMYLGSSNSNELNCEINDIDSLAMQISEDWRTTDALNILPEVDKDLYYSNKLNNGTSSYNSNLKKATSSLESKEVLSWTPSSVNPDDFLNNFNEWQNDSYLLKPKKESVQDLAKILEDSCKPFENNALLKKSNITSNHLAEISQPAALSVAPAESGDSTEMFVCLSQKSSNSDFVNRAIAYEELGLESHFKPTASENFKGSNTQVCRNAVENKNHSKENVGIKYPMENVQNISKTWIEFFDKTRERENKLLKSLESNSTHSNLNDTKPSQIKLTVNCEKETYVLNTTGDNKKQPTKSATEKEENIKYVKFKSSNEEFIIKAGKKGFDSEFKKKLSKINNFKPVKVRKSLPNKADLKNPVSSTENYLFPALLFFQNKTHTVQPHFQELSSVEQSKSVLKQHPSASKVKSCSNILYKRSNAFEKVVKENNSTPLPKISEAEVKITVKNQLSGKIKEHEKTSSNLNNTKTTQQRNVDLPMEGIELKQSHLQETNDLKANIITNQEVVDGAKVNNKKENILRTILEKPVKETTMAKALKRQRLALRSAKECAEPQYEKIMRKTKTLPNLRENKMCANLLNTKENKKTSSNLNNTRTIEQIANDLKADKINKQKAVVAPKSIRENENFTLKKAESEKTETKDLKRQQQNYKSIQIPLNSDKKYSKPHEAITDNTKGSPNLSKTKIYGTLQNKISSKSRENKETSTRTTEIKTAPLEMENIEYKKSRSQETNDLKANKRKDEKIVAAVKPKREMENFQRTALKDEKTDTNVLKRQEKIEVAFNSNLKNQNVVVNCDTFSDFEANLFKQLAAQSKRTVEHNYCSKISTPNRIINSEKVNEPEFVFSVKAFSTEPENTSCDITASNSLVVKNEASNPSPLISDDDDVEASSRYFDRSPDQFRGFSKRYSANTSPFSTKANVNSKIKFQEESPSKLGLDFIDINKNLEINSNHQSDEKSSTLINVNQNKTQIQTQAKTVTSTIEFFDKKMTISRTKQILKSNVTKVVAVTREICNTQHTSQTQIHEKDKQTSISSRQQEIKSDDSKSKTNSQIVKLTRVDHTKRNNGNTDVNEDHQTNYEIITYTMELLDKETPVCEEKQNLNSHDLKTKSQTVTLTPGEESTNSIDSFDAPQIKMFDSVLLTNEKVDSFESNEPQSFRVMRSDAIRQYSNKRNTKGDKSVSFDKPRIMRLTRSIAKFETKTPDSVTESSKNKSDSFGSKKPQNITKSTQFLSTNVTQTNRLTRSAAKYETKSAESVTKKRFKSVVNDEPQNKPLTRLGALQRVEAIKNERKRRRIEMLPDMERIGSLRQRDYYTKD